MSLKAVSLTFDLGCKMSPRAVNNPNHDDVVVLLSVLVVVFGPGLQLGLFDCLTAP
jgi:hypothetical protein